MLRDTARTCRFEDTKVVISCNRGSKERTNVLGGPWHKLATTSVIRERLWNKSFPFIISIRLDIVKLMLSHTFLFATKSFPNEPENFGYCASDEAEDNYSYDRSVPRGSYDSFLLVEYYDVACVENVLVFREL